MKNKLPVFTLLLVTLLFLSVVGTSAIAESWDEITTRASISFADGKVEFTSDMERNLDFGTRYIPLLASTYPSIGYEDETHNLAVADTRTNAGNWTVTVGLTPFTKGNSDAPSSFNAVIRFRNAVYSKANSEGNIPGFTGESNIVVASGGDNVLVMSAGNELDHGMYGGAWKNEDVTLSIGSSEVDKVSFGNYEAQLKWVLTLGPVSEEVERR